MRMFNRRSRIPGSRFKPTDQEFIQYLSRRIDGKKTCSFITDIMDMYEKEPWLLKHVIHPRFKKNEWYYFVIRKKLPGIKKSDSIITSRQLFGSGRWKTDGGLTQIMDGFKVGSMQNLTFKANGKTEKYEITTGWVVHEFLLDKPSFQEAVLCRIRFSQGKDNSQYAPRLEPIVIGDNRLVPYQQQPPEEGVGEDGLRLVENMKKVESKEHKEEDFENDFEGLGQGMDLSQPPMAIQEPSIGSCSGQAVSSYSVPQHQQFMGQDSNYPMNGGIVAQILGCLSPMESQQQRYGQGFGDMAHEYQNQYLGQETDPWQVPMMNQALNGKQRWNGYSGPYSAHPYHQYLGQGMVPMTQGIMDVHHEQFLGAQYQQFSINGGIEQHQDFGFCGQFVGESLGQQENQILGQQATHLSAMEQLQWNGYSGPYLAQPHDQGMVPVTQGMMEHQGVGPSALYLAQRQSNQYLGHNNDLPTVPMVAQQQDNVVENLPAQLQLEIKQETVLPINQGIEPRGGHCGSSTHNELIQQFLGDETAIITYQEMDSDMANFGDKEWAQQLGENTPDEEADLRASLGKCNTVKSLLDYFCPM